MLLRSFLQGKDLLDFEKIKERGWKLVCIDDNVIFDEGASRLAKAACDGGASELMALSIPQLLSGNAVSALVMPATQRGIEAFQNADNYERYVLSFDACLLFSLPLGFILLRTGDSQHTIYAGPARFLTFATGVKVGKADAYALGDLTRDSPHLLAAYRPVQVDFRLPEG